MGDVVSRAVPAWVVQGIDPSSVLGVVVLESPVDDWVAPLGSFVIMVETVRDDPARPVLPVVVGWFWVHDAAMAGATTLAQRFGVERQDFVVPKWPRLEAST